MTDERDKSVSVVDQTVSRAYREISDERAPEHLDRAILAKAARAARPRYARSRAWTRPLAWAATIALSVAIVLELTQVPAPDDALFEPAMPAFDDTADAPAAVRPAPAAEEAAAATATALGRSNDVLPKTPEKTSMMQKTSPPLAIEADAESRLREATTPEPGLEPAAAPVDAAEFEVKDKEFLRRADEVVEARYLNTREELAAPRQAARSEAAALASAAEECPEAVRHDPHTWLECIEGLDEAGLEEEAETQRQLWQEAFPTFELP